MKLHLLLCSHIVLVVRQKTVPTAHNKVCGLSCVTGSGFLERQTVAVGVLKCIFGAPSSTRCKHTHILWWQQWPTYTLSWGGCFTLFLIKSYLFSAMVGGLPPLFIVQVSCFLYRKILNLFFPSFSLRLSQCVFVSAWALVPYHK